MHTHGFKTVLANRATLFEAARALCQSVDGGAKKLPKPAPAATFHLDENLRKLEEQRASRHCHDPEYTAIPQARTGRHKIRPTAYPTSTKRLVHLHNLSHTIRRSVIIDCVTCSLAEIVRRPFLNIIARRLVARSPSANSL